MDSIHLRECIIRPTLMLMEELWKGAYSEQAVNLILGTACQESGCGKYVVQIGGGPARGIYQCEVDTHEGIWENYLAFRPEKASFIRSLSTQRLDLEGNLLFNLQYATAIARLKYWRRRFEWPEDPNDVEALGVIWKEQYNTLGGKGTVEEFVKNYHYYSQHRSRDIPEYKHHSL